MGFPRQEYSSGFPFPSPGDLPDPGIEPESPAWQVDSLPPEKTLITILPQLITILPQITMETIKYLNRKLKKMLHIEIFGMQLIPVEGIL